MTNATMATLGTWKLNNQRLTAAYYDVDAIRITNSLGHDFVVTEREWLDRYDGLRDNGWTKTSKAA